MPNLEQFEENIFNSVNQGLTAKQIAEKTVVAALEAEYGKTFTFSPHFAKMVDVLAEIIVTNPDLRRQTLSMASRYLQKKNEQYQTNRV
ncbi:hypothetical protein A2311_05515 [candidate division WOR-1 bacterium RIFOXYB2_FULL_48_7]|uniref:Uncharacterized protein n=1 Tax=candidate division WOR-1 bacterium RIFOXYB2_FULL_48_7 TaxID=1802583 RepID=A0A1F4TPM7_UNCSA|nr:MAG: hypothetical protein A2311_05515 [candidate division WOR-1 bacterium RIFOXYB2_FULL_48_7]